MEVQAAMEERLVGMNPSEICSAQFLCWLHEEFFRRLPEPFRLIKSLQGKNYAVEPGKLRDCEVRVVQHLAPASRQLGEFLKRFEKFYGPFVNKEPHSLIAASAAHQRLAWIHPFPDGNGRVTRLFTQAWLVKAGVDGGGLWTVSHALARQILEYQVALNNADQMRMNDFDGRGHLSQRHLGAFCRFFLTAAVDEVKFMKGLLAPVDVLNRIVSYAERSESKKKLAHGSSAVLREIFLRGEISREETGRMVGGSSRTAQNVIANLLAQKLVTACSQKGSFRLGFPSEVASYYFPGFYPSVTH
jgi:Fic family protein